ncbi:MAG TPA: sulfotransferase [Gammaproteobacteria bacterium]
MQFRSLWDLKKSWFKSLKRRYRAYRDYVRSIGKIKYFCIGRNKTGTTSIKQAFIDLGFPVGSQRAAEVLYDRHYFAGEFQPIIDYCRSARVFQDVPFSCPETFKHLDKAYPGSKFILTIRDDAEQWYSSLTRFHAKKFGKGGRIPTAEDLQQEKYPGTGLRINVMRLHGTPEHDPYNKEIMIRHYNDYNAAVIDYFKNRPSDLLVLNLAKPGAYRKFLEFVGVKSDRKEFPWENRT